LLSIFHFVAPQPFTSPLSSNPKAGEVELTGRQTLLQLICLVAILQDERVQEAVASDFKLDLGVLAVALYAGGCDQSLIST
jgi:hypothetical protein